PTQSQLWEITAPIPINDLALVRGWALSDPDWQTWLEQSTRDWERYVVPRKWLRLAELRVATQVAAPATHLDEYARFREAEDAEGRASDIDLAHGRQQVR